MTGDEGVVHALIEDLAAGKLAKQSQFQQTEEQKKIKIPSYLIYLAGLIVKTSSPSVDIGKSRSAQSLTARDNVQFESLQKRFAVLNENDMPIFRLSPRLCPTEDQLSSIQTDLARKQQELDRKATQAAEDLLSEELNSTREDGVKQYSANSKRKAKKKKKKTTIKSNSTKMPDQREVADSSSHDENLPPLTTAPDQSTSSTSTLKQVISKIQAETISSTIENDSDASAWIPVCSSKDKKARNQSASSHSTTNHYAKSAGADSKDQLESSHQAASVINDADRTGTPHDETEGNAKMGSSDPFSLKDQSLSSDNQTFATKTATKKGEAPKLKTETGPLDTAETAPSPTSVEQLNERIRLLEQALNDKDQELQQEKQANAKMISQKQQQFDDQVQAFQLRLYISETRLKTFEEALEQHVQAVASNVATSIECNSTSGNDTATATATTTTANGRNILHQYPSPKKRWVSQSNHAKDEEPASPLISKLFRRQKK
ncbi:MAG: hypothetical protein SGBAC_008859 [Bacillariaceae sp.]